MRYKDLKTDTWKLDSVRVKGVVRMCVCVSCMWEVHMHTYAGSSLMSGCLSLSFSAFLFEARPLTEPGAWQSAKMTDQ